MGVAAQGALLPSFFPEFSEDQILIGKMDRCPCAEDDPVAEEIAARVLLAGHQQVVALAIDAVRAVFVLGRGGETIIRSELQEVGYMDVLGLHPL